MGLVVIFVMLSGALKTLVTIRFQFITDNCLDTLLDFPSGIHRRNKVMQVCNNTRCK